MSLTALIYSDVKSKYFASNLSLKVRCDTTHFCQYSDFLNTVRIFDYGVTSSLAEPRGGTD